MGRKKKFLLNTVFSIVYEILVFGMGIVLPRLILSNYGSAINGLITSITQFLTIISLGEMGIGAVIKSNLYKPLLEKDDYKISCIIKSSKKFFKLLAYVLLVYTIVLCIIYPIIVIEDFDFLFTILMIVIISISSFSQYFIGITYQLLLNADQKAYVQLVINSLSVIINTIGCIILIKMNASIILVKLFTSIIFTLRPFLLLLYVKKKYKILKDVKYEGEPIKQKWNGFAQHLSTTIQDNTDTIVLTLFSTLSNVSIYGVYNLVINGVKQMVNTIYTGLNPVFGEIIASENKTELTNVFDYSEWFIHMLCTVLFSITSVMILPFISLYTKDINDANYYVPVFAYLITICGMLRCVQMIYNIVVHSAGHFKQTQKACLVEPLINIVISIICVFKFGLIGVTIGTIISLTYRLIYLIIYLNKNIVFHPLIKVFKVIFVDTIIASIIIILGYLMSLKCDNYWQWIFAATVIACVSLIITVLVNVLFYPQMLKKTISIIKVKINRKDKYGKKS